MEKRAKKLIGGHRGSPKRERENSVESFKRAISEKVDFVEFDLRFSKDKKMIIHHNPDINGCLLKETNYDEILRLSRSLGYRVPLLEEVLRVCRDKIKIDVEIKEPETTSFCIEETLKYFKTSQFIITSFNPEVLEIVNNKFRGVSTGLLFDNETKSCLKENIVKEKPKYVLPSIDNFDYFSQELSEFIKENLMEPLAIYWTVNSKEDILKTLKDSLTFGIITDFPAKAVAENSKLTL